MAVDSALREKVLSFAATKTESAAKRVADSNDESALFPALLGIVATDLPILNTSVATLEKGIKDLQDACKRVIESDEKFCQSMQALHTEQKSVIAQHKEAIAQYDEKIEKIRAGVTEKLQESSDKYANYLNIIGQLHQTIEKKVDALAVTTSKKAKILVTITVIACVLAAGSVGGMVYIIVSGVR